MDVNGRKAGVLENFGIADPFVYPPYYLDIVLHAEETRFEALGSQALRVHVYVSISSGELAILSHRTDIGHFGKDRRERIIGSVAEGVAEAVFLVILPTYSQSLVFFELSHLPDAFPVFFELFPTVSRGIKRIRPTYLLHGKPETLYSAFDATFHLPSYIPYHVQMIGH